MRAAYDLCTLVAVNSSFEDLDELETERKSTAASPGRLLSYSRNGILVTLPSGSLER